MPDAIYRLSFQCVWVAAGETKLLLIIVDVMFLFSKNK